MNGLDICRHLKSQAKTRPIPVIMVSASPEIGRLSKEAGADNYIEKPFEISYLLKIIYDYTNLAENAIAEMEHPDKAHHDNL